MKVINIIVIHNKTTFSSLSLHSSWVDSMLNFVQQWMSKSIFPKSCTRQRDTFWIFTTTVNLSSQTVGSISSEVSLLSLSLSTTVGNDQRVFNSVLEGKYPHPYGIRPGSCFWGRGGRGHISITQPWHSAGFDDKNNFGGNVDYLRMKDNFWVKLITLGWPLYTMSNPLRNLCMVVPGF